MNKDFRVRMTTPDGQLVQDRKSDVGFWFTLGMRLDTDFADLSLKRDCAEKGVRLVSYKADENGVDAVVEWL